MGGDTVRWRVDDPTVQKVVVVPAGLDAASAEWLRALTGGGPRRDAAAGRLQLTPRQREVFVAIVLNEVPLDTLVAELGSNRNAIYKRLFDSRRKLRGALAAGGYLSDEC
jgi:RNA polymerase sigma-70 factor, ECF subfamily